MVTVILQGSLTTFFKETLVIIPDVFIVYITGLQFIVSPNPATIVIYACSWSSTRAFTVWFGACCFRPVDGLWGKYAMETKNRPLDALLGKAA